MQNNPVNFVDPSGLTWRTNLGFFRDWAIGTGGNIRIYSTYNVESQEMQKSPGAKALRDAFYKGGCKNYRGFAYGVGQAAWDTLINPFTANPSSTAAQVGGFAGANAIKNNDGTVTFTIPNIAGTRSFFYHLVPDRKGDTGPMRNIEQIFQWTEEMDECNCKGN